MKTETTLKKSGFWKVDGIIGKIMMIPSKITPFILIIMALAATINVIIAKVAGVSIPSVNDWISHLMIPVVWLCLGNVAVNRELISVDFVSKHFSKTVNSIIQAVGYLIGAVTTAYIMTRQWSLMIENINSGKWSSTNALHFPLWPFSLILVIGLGLTVIAFIWCAVRKFAPEKPAEGKEV